MSFKTTFALTAVAFSLGSAAQADDHAGLRGYALAQDGGTLVTMADLAQPGTVETYALEMPLRAIAYRPVTGQLLGYADGAIYEVDPASGKLTDLGATFMADAVIAEGAVAFDFNNQIDAVRAVGADGSNLVYFPQGFGDNDERANSVRRFTDAFYVAGDMSAGSDPVIFANAYTNAIAGTKAGSTAQYALDAGANALVTLANNAGELASVGNLSIEGATVDVSDWGGFDIVSPEEGKDMAYAILQIEGAETAGLYAVDLGTGALTEMADLGMGGFTGFAVAQAQ
ncbi:Lipoprotein [Roseovarius sp. EC-HK134]|uniref:Lipoprotein n=1 Tax=Roseovarius mucosus TaxID=215743 RepID=A0A1V0RRU4_9RHOB|nr:MULTISPECIES: DUF4394 domain-containing protein [Roseovarius]ARE84332.1 lipoprotein [Roseovarius mucosus]MBW4975569.1 DUF4394 domain-containing protein [Roseovarius mucosus]VVT17856.1 Lipoprotein [Roseovarius sp. EC-HK134]VVT18230.1 Lipoprotein [Roseovarius sp. EC-SD190]